MKYRFMLPAIFLLIVLLFFVANLLGAGHGSAIFDFIVYCAYPAAFLTDVLAYHFGEFGGVWFFAGMAAGALQYFFIGYAIDVLKRRRRGTG